MGTHARFLDEISRGRIVGQRCPRAARSTCRRAARARAAASPPTETVEVAGRAAPSRRSASCACPSGEHPPQAAVRRRAHPARRRRHPVLRAGRRLRVERRAHGPARRGGLGAARGAGGRRFANIRHFRPTGEPDVAVREVQGASVMRDVAVVSFAQTPYVRRERERSEVEMLMPVIAQAIERSGIPKARDRLHLLGQLATTSPGQAVRLRRRGRCARRLAADLRVARRDGRRLGALRGVGQDPVRRTRTRRWCSPSGAPRWARCPRRSRMQLDPYTLAPLGVDAISLAALQARALLDAGLARERDMAEVAVRSRRDAKRNPYAQLKGDFEVEKLLAEPYLIVAAAQARLPADHRRRGGGGARRRRRRAARLPRGRPGSAASTTASSRTSRASATSRASPSTALAGEKAGRRRRPSTSPSCTRPSRTRS